ncbi:MAG: hypothetical protein ACR2I8_05685 [Steroidobacteraceae bacterium]
MKNADRGERQRMTREYRSSFELEPDPPCGLIVRWSGGVRVADLLRAANVISALPSFDNLRYVLNDFSGATGLAGDHDEHAIVLQDAAAQLIGSRYTNPRVLHAGAVTDPVVATMLDELSEVAGIPIRQFDSFEGAVGWLSAQNTNALWLYPQAASN